MSTIIVGDLHGKIEIAKEILEDRNQAVVFVGDYLDSFERSTRDHIDLLDMIFDAVENRDNVQALIGNHELSYLDPYMRCSGWSSAIAAAVLAPERVEKFESLQIYTEVDGYLISHAGVSKTWLPSDIETTDVAQYLDTCSDARLYEIGFSRGGQASCGGPLWCDYWREFKPVPGLKQVFGHTRYRPPYEPSGIIEHEGNYLIDCLDEKKELLHVHEGVASRMEI